MMGRVGVVVLLLAAAVAGLALTARAQQSAPEPATATLASATPGVVAPVVVAPDGAGRPVVEPSPQVCAPDRILVKVRPGVDAAALIARYGGTIVQTIVGIDVQAVAVPYGTGQQAIDALSADPDVVYAEPDQIVTAQGSSPGGCP